MSRGNHAGPISFASEPLLRENDSMIVCQLAWNKLVVEPREAYNGRGTPRWNSIYLQIYTVYICPKQEDIIEGQQLHPDRETRPEIHWNPTLSGVLQVRATKVVAEADCNQEDGTAMEQLKDSCWRMLDESGQTLRHSVVVWFPRGFSDSFRPNWGWKPKVRHLHPQTCWISIPGGVHRGLLFGPLGSQRSSPCTVAHCLHIGSSASRFAPRSACTWEMAWNWRRSMELSNRYELVVCKVFWSGPAGIVPIYVARGEIPKIGIYENHRPLQRTKQNVGIITNTHRSFKVTQICVFQKDLFRCLPKWPCTMRGAQRLKWKSSGNSWRICRVSEQICQICFFCSFLAVHGNAQHFTHCLPFPCLPWKHQKKK